MFLHLHSSAPSPQATPPGSLGRPHSPHGASALPQRPSAAYAAAATAAAPRGALPPTSPRRHAPALQVQSVRGGVAQLSGSAAAAAAMQSLSCRYSAENKHGGRDAAGDSVMAEQHTPALEATAAWVQGTRGAAQLHAQQFATALQMSSAQLAALQLEQQRQAARHAQRRCAQRPERQHSTEVQTHRNALYVPSELLGHEAAAAQQQHKRRPQTQQQLSAGQQLQQRIVRQYARAAAPQSVGGPARVARVAAVGGAAGDGRAAPAGSPPRSAGVSAAARCFVTEQTGPWRARAAEDHSAAGWPQAQPVSAGGGWAQPHGSQGAGDAEDAHVAARLHWERQGCAFPQ